MTPLTKEQRMDMMRASIPSKADFDKMEADRIARRTNPSPMEKLLQNTTVLSVWLQRCEAAGMKYVPATFSPDISVDEIMIVLDGKGDDVPTIVRAQEWLTENYKPATSMWRWEQCAPYDVKYIVGEGRPLGSRVDFNIDDPRFIDIIFECNVATTRLAVRPIVEIKRHNKYPVEFRCYVFGEKEVAVSSYYPQRRLPDEYFSAAEESAKLGLHLYPHVETAFTADFCLVGEELIFLEGGPPFGAGAHPCCFNPERLKAGRVLLEQEEY
jgi:hypothetical protein